MDHLISFPPDALTISRRAIAASRSACEATQALVSSSLTLITSVKERTMATRDTVASPRPWRPVVLCAECRRGIDSSGVMIVRGRTVVHVACDRQERRDEGDRGPRSSG
jgi:hypothetical protein